MALIDTLGTGVSALQSFTTGLDTVANDIANINTTAFKGSGTKFADTFTGAGVQVSATTTNFSQGSLSPTGVNTNLGISGNGYFTVQDPTTGSQYVTRDGTSASTVRQPCERPGLRGHGPHGRNVDGRAFDAGTDQAGRPAHGTELQSVTISTSGDVVESYANGSQATTNQVLLQNFVNPDLLVSQGENLYSNLSAPGPCPARSPSRRTTHPGSSGLGTVEAGTLEQSNVDLTQEFADMITMQRAFEANSRLVTVSDTILQDIINLKQP